MLRSALGRLWWSRPARWLRRKAIGSDPRRLPRRAAVVAIAILVATALFGVWQLVTNNVDPQSGSLPYLRPVLALTTSTWTYLVLLLLISHRLLIGRSDRYARMAAETSGYSKETVKRLAAEAKNPTGVRVVATSDDTREDIAERVRTGAESGEEHELELNPEAFSVSEDAEDESDSFEWIDEQEIEPVDRSDDEGSRWVRRLLHAGRHLMVYLLAPALVLVAFSRAAIAVWYLGDALFLGGQQVSWNLIASRWLVESAVVAGVIGVATLLTVEIFQLISWWRSREPADREPDTDHGEEDVLEEVVDDVEWLKEWKHVRMDLAATLNLTDILWHGLVPAGIAFVALLLVVQIWVQPWLYPALAAVALLVGALNYGRISWSRQRTLRALRQDRETNAWGECAIIVERVELPETTMHFASLAGRRYAHPDIDVFAEEVAHRAYENVNGVPISPSLLEKYARQLEQMYPDLEGFRDQQKKDVMERLLTEIEESGTYGLVPKAKLVEDVVEHDIQSRRYSPGDDSKGKGYDPALVREAYRELVPAALVEQEIELVNRNGDGPATVTAVRRREDPLPPEFSEVRAHFSGQFANYAEWDAAYQLPDVDDRLEAEPVYAGRGGATAAVQAAEGVQASGV